MRSLENLSDKTQKIPYEDIEALLPDLTREAFQEAIAKAKPETLQRYGFDSVKDYEAARKEISQRRYPIHLFEDRETPTRHYDIRNFEAEFENQARVFLLRNIFRIGGAEAVETYVARQPMSFVDYIPAKLLSSQSMYNSADGCEDSYIRLDKDYCMIFTNSVGGSAFDHSDGRVVPTSEVVEQIRRNRRVRGTK